LADKKPQQGNTLAGRLARLGLKSDSDFVLHLPLRYEDETCITALADARPGIAAQFEVEVLGNEIAYRPRRQLLARVRDASGALSLRFLNFYPSQQKVLQPGTRLRVFGEVHEGYLGPEIIHPRFHVVAAGDALPEGLTPVYPTTAGLGQATLRRLIEKALARADFADTLPAGTAQRLDLPGWRRSHTLPAYAAARHGAGSLEARDYPAWRRMQVRRTAGPAAQPAPRLPRPPRARRAAPGAERETHRRAAAVAALPPDRAQQRAWREIAADLGQPHPMQRLLQGDVGSGKTSSPRWPCCRRSKPASGGVDGAHRNPRRAALPQARRLAGTAGHRVAWLSGSLKKRDKRGGWIASAPATSCWRVGTHALIEDPVEFARPGPGHRRRAAPLRRAPAPGPALKGQGQLRRTS
jgi:ATP-dependent DNA helicase RecG